MKKHRYPHWLKTLQRYSHRTLPKDTKISTYFEYNDLSFESMVLPDGRLMVRRVYTWGDGELMDFGFEYSDGIGRTGLNPLNLVKIYYKEPSMSELMDDLDIFIRLNNDTRRGEVKDGRHNDQTNTERRL